MFVVSPLLALEPLLHISAPLSNANETLTQIREIVVLYVSPFFMARSSANLIIIIIIIIIMFIIIIVIIYIISIVIIIIE